MTMGTIGPVIGPRFDRHGRGEVALAATLGRTRLSRLLVAAEPHAALAFPHELGRASLNGTRGGSPLTLVVDGFAEFLQ